MGFNNGISWSFNNGSLGRAGFNSEYSAHLVFQRHEERRCGSTRCKWHALDLNDSLLLSIPTWHGDKIEGFGIHLDVIPVSKGGYTLAVHLEHTYIFNRNHLPWVQEQVYTAQHLQQRSRSTRPESRPRFNKGFPVSKSPLTHTQYSRPGRGSVQVTSFPDANRSRVHWLVADHHDSRTSQDLTQTETTNSF